MIVIKRLDMINIHKDEKLKIENRYAQRHRTEQKFACT